MTFIIETNGSAPPDLGACPASCAMRAPQYIGQVLHTRIGYSESKFYPTSQGVHQTRRLIYPANMQSPNKTDKDLEETTKHWAPSCTPMIAAPSDIDTTNSKVDRHPEYYFDIVIFQVSDARNCDQGDLPTGIRSRTSCLESRVATFQPNQTSSPICFSYHLQTAPRPRD